MATDTPQPGNPPATVHEAGPVSGPSGGVVRGAELTDAQAVRRRSQGLDVVVCGPDGRANRRKAQEIESVVGTPYVFHVPHARAGPHALPHYQQVSGSPAGHSFYEVGARRARRNPS